MKRNVFAGALIAAIAAFSITTPALADRHHHGGHHGGQHEVFRGDHRDHDNWHRAGGDRHHRERFHDHHHHHHHNDFGNFAAGMFLGGILDNAINND